jgi:glycerol-3-phosphate dehydrogenase
MRIVPAQLPPEFDVAVVGGGINGASVYHELAAAGYRVLLVDRADFAGATSQASAMMIWGGLLYLKDWELATVARLSASRDRLIAQRPSEVQVRSIRYIPEPGGRSRAFVQAVLYAYWLLGAARRSRPRFDREFEERDLLKRGNASGALTYEEAGLATSDARFVLSWILNTASADSVARNYCALESAAYDRALRAWRLDLSDTPEGTPMHVRARLVINAAGGWTDEVNQKNGLQSPYRHLLSRGVSVALPRDRCHRHHLAFDNGVGGNAMSLVPWGPVAVWGSTDTIHPDMDRAWQVEASDINFLLAQLNRHLARPASPADAVSVRCGVRPVAVPRNAKVDEYSPSLSRRHRIHTDSRLPWISIYGGKLSGCTALARAVRARVRGRIGGGRVSAGTARADAQLGDPPVERFPGLERPVVSPAWSAAHEQCRTLEDYLRRRTNIAQWVRRGGFGADLEHIDHLRSISLTLHGGNATEAARDLERYRARVDDEWRLLQGASI